MSKETINKTETLASREKVLKDKFEAFCTKCAQKKGRLLYQDGSKEFFDLKNAVQDINNVLTLKTTFAFVDFLEKEKIVTEQEAAVIRKEIDEKKPNSNGFDIQCEKGKILAEVKCNIPINKGDKFGAAQINAIIKDLNGLENPKEFKSKSKIPDSSKYFRFMVFLDIGGNRVQNAVDALKKKDNVPDFIVWNSSKKVLRGKTYVVFVEF